MKYAITGAAGHISKPLAEQLLKAGHQVTVIGRDQKNLEELMKAGAFPVIGSLEDVEFLKTAFAGSDAVFTMCPPNFNYKDLKSFNECLGRNYTDAIKANGIKYVVNLSSIGAHLTECTGPVSGLHNAEKLLNGLKNVNIKHLRPAFFYSNLMANINMIKNMGIIGSNFSIAANRFPVSDPVDISTAAAEELLRLTFSGHSVRYIASDESGTDEIAAVIGKAIGKPELKWIKFTDAQVLTGMQQSGVPTGIAGDLVEMFTAMDGDRFTEDYWTHHPSLGIVKLEDFAKEFAAAYYADE